MFLSIRNDSRMLGVCRNSWSISTQLLFLRIAALQIPKQQCHHASLPQRRSASSQDSTLSFTLKDSFVNILPHDKSAGVWYHTFHGAKLRSLSCCLLSHLGHYVLQSCVVQHDQVCFNSVCKCINIRHVSVQSASRTVCVVELVW